MKIASLPSLLVAALLASTALADPAPTTVAVFNHAQVDNAFEKGLPLTANDSFKLSAGRRLTAGGAEVHEHDTDIFYVQAGEATFITGGTPHHLSKGDVIIIPAGTPHQYTEVTGTFLYFVVKVTR